MKKTTLLASVLLSSSLLQGSFIKGDAGSLDVKFHHVVPSQKQYFETHLVKS
jgi:hypothetical protein